MAGGDHRGVRIHAGAGDDREDAAVRVLADLKIVLIDERTGAVAQRSQIVSGFRPSRLVQFRSIDQHEPDVKLAFDDERVPINDASHVAHDAKADGSRARRL